MAVTVSKTVTAQRAQVARGSAEPRAGRAPDPKPRSARGGVTTWDPSDFARRGLPRPVYDGKPVPWTTPVREGLPAFGRFSLRLVAEAELNGLCDVCGLPLSDPVYFFRYSASGDHHFAADEKRPEPGAILPAGLHLPCARLSLAHCPHLTPAAGPDSMPLDVWRAEVGTLAR
jgi:hypothetical protein